MNVKRIKSYYEINVIGGIFREWRVFNAVYSGVLWILKLWVDPAHERPYLYKKPTIKSKPVALLAIYFIYFVI